MNFLKHKFLVIFVLLQIVLLTYYTFVYTPQLAGDISEYYGMTESLLNHGSIVLSEEDRLKLETILPSAYFVDPQYYITGRDNARYPVHFFGYSVLITPVRVILDFLGINTLKVFAVSNMLIVLATLGFIFSKWVKKDNLRVTLSMLVYLSPLLWFIVWPGPDILFVCLLLISIFFIAEGSLLSAALFTAFASWHSQPLMILSLVLLGYAIAHKRFSSASLIRGFSVALLLAVPYLYNYYAFGVLTPWTLIDNGWTQMNGFGIQNIQVQKFFEQFFDLNVGLFWYMPLIFITALFGVGMYLIKSRQRIHGIVLAILMTTMLYHTNPAWHYGTAGYGPTRHILYILPYVIFAAYYALTRLPQGARKQVVYFIVIIQIIVGSLMGYANPNFEKTLHHNPIAQFVLNHYPGLYSPTPEIFVDRTNHADSDLPQSAFYLYNGVCRKAYVLLTEKQRLLDTCGYIPLAYHHAFDEPFKRQANYWRTIVTTEATLWPHTQSCDGQGEFVCMEPAEEVARLTGISIDRIRKPTQAPFRGVWKILKGPVTTINIPPGYTVDYQSLEGIYVTY